MGMVLLLLVSMAGKQMALVGDRAMSQFIAKISRTICRMRIRNILMTFRNILVTMQMLGMASGGVHTVYRQVAEVTPKRAMPHPECPILL